MNIFIKVHFIYYYSLLHDKYLNKYFKVNSNNFNNIYRDFNYLKHNYWLYLIREFSQVVTTDDSSSSGATRTSSNLVVPKYFFSKILK